MAQWSHADRTLYAKLVYYGPAVGGKTTNLKSLHALTDPEGTTKLLSINTANDRTLFFDLLPFELGTILGYKVALKLYTVPGQVQYEATRRTVLASADAVVFVADSTRRRAEENRASLQSLRLNMRANRLDPETAPVLFQFNKQDLPDAAPPEEVASWLGVDPRHGFTAVAIEGRGVMETFVAACKAMVGRLVALADARTRRTLDPQDLSRQVDRIFAPYIARAMGPGPGVAAAPSEREDPLVPEASEILEQSLETSLRLGENLVGERERARRLEREADALRRLGASLRGVETSFDRDTIVRTVLALSGEILGAAGTSLVAFGGSGTPRCESTWGRAEEPLLATDAGRELLARLMAAGRPCLVEDLATEVGAAGVSGLRAVVAAPVVGSGPRLLIAYAPAPDGRLGEMDVRFLDTVAGHLAVGLDKARLYDELARHRDRLEEQVEERTRELRRAYEDLRALDRMKDRFLSSLSHEMRTPLAAILSAASFLHDYDGSASDRREMAASVLDSGRSLQGLLDRLFRVARLESGTERPEPAGVELRGLVEKALGLAGSPPVAVHADAAVSSIVADGSRLARALANLIDNAVKFSPEGSPVEVRVAPARLKRGAEVVEGIVLSVSDRGPGVPDEDRERIFAPFEQGGDLLTSKPSGVGLGLYEARAIARLHGGDVLYRERAGGGSEFRLLVPARIPEAVETAQAAAWSG